MSRPINLADPDFEPTDEELMELSRRAFAGVAEERRIALDKHRAGIVAAQKEAVAALHQSQAPRRTP